MITWDGKRLIALVILLLISSCKDSLYDKWSLPKNFSSIDKTVDSLLNNQKSSYLDRNITISITKDYKLKGRIEDNVKSGWWVFNGKKDSLKIEYINIGKDVLKNQIIYYKKGIIDNRISKYYKINKELANDSVKYEIKYFVPNDVNEKYKEYKIKYAFKKESKITQGESNGIRKKDYVIFNLLLQKCEGCVLKAQLTQTSLVEYRYIGINESYFTDTINTVNSFR